MEDASPNLILVFMIPFHIGGGAAMGLALRRTMQEGFGFSSLARNGFLLVWGALFGGIPLTFGLSLEPGWFVLLQIGLFLGTIAGVVVFYDWLRELYSQPGMYIASFGFAFFIMGAAMATLLLGEGEMAGLFVGLLFGGVGGIITLAGIWMLLRNSG